MLIFLALPAVQAFSDTFWWMDGDDNKEEEAVVEGEKPEIQEPFFALMFALTDGDSLGTWSADVIASRLNDYGRESRFPVEQLFSITRRPAVGQERESRLQKTVTRMWEFELAEYLDRAMPYSILGYHPGSLLVSKKLVFSEWSLGGMDFPVSTDEEPTHFEPLDDIVIMRLDEGHIILDVDGWLDAILGKGLDDASTLGMALARYHGKPVGLAISVGREGRHIFGELDLKEDKVKSHGSPQARALSRIGRSYTDPHPARTNNPWPEDL